MKNIIFINLKYFTSTLLAILLFGESLCAQVRIKDIVKIENENPVSLIGYGLVVGLDGSGDRAVGTRGSVFTVQSVSNMLEHFGITVPKIQLRTRNAAAVMVTCRMPAFSGAGSQFDVTVSSLGDAVSLEGGVLLATPLLDTGGRQLGMAQGPMAVGGYNLSTKQGERFRKNHSLVARVPNGGYLTLNPTEKIFDITKPARLFLNEPDFVTANKIAEAINLNFSGADTLITIAEAASPGLVNVTFPDSINSVFSAINFIATLEVLEVEADMDARVVINERTGTIVAGGKVTIDEVMISHGNLTIHTRTTPIISQPNAFSGGTTVLSKVSDTRIRENPAQTAVIEETTTVSELALALNTLGLKPRDIISIFQSIKQAGALRARLIIN
jgi:flagellar P-ring protein precursor FlgI